VALLFADTKNGRVPYAKPQADSVRGIRRCGPASCCWNSAGIGLGLVRLPGMWLRLLCAARLWLRLPVILSAALCVCGILSPTRFWVAWLVWAALGLAAVVVVQPKVWVLELFLAHFRCRALGTSES
jgi:hypothetical protein